jgi:transcriptional regulator with XRE-family HTH domain
MANKKPHAVDIRVGARVREARMLANMSQEKLGNALKLTFQQVQKYEKGVNRIGAGRLSDIAGIFQRPISWFYDGTRANFAGAEGDDPFQQLATSRNGLALARGWNAIDDAGMRAAVLAMVEAAAAKCRRGEYRKVA